MLNRGSALLICDGRIMKCCAWASTTWTAGPLSLQQVAADFYSLPVLYPQFDVQQAFVRLLSPFWERQKQCDQECKTLAALRDALLPKLMSGEIRPREAKKAIEAVA
jgi:hypothetical protein